jgi:preprotein translocase SecF subunit
MFKFDFLYHLVEHRRTYYIFSGILISLGILAMIVSYVVTGTVFQLGVDFRSGTRYEVQFSEPVTEDQIRAVFVDAGVVNPSVIALRGADLQNAWQIRAEFATPEESDQIVTALGELAPLVPGTINVQSVSPTVGKEVTRAAFLAIAVAAIVILFYIMYVFRQVPNSFRYGASAVVAMIHDLLIIFGFAALTGAFLGWEVDALFLTAVLTVTGFSLQDTIVTFDRIRENIAKRSVADFERLVDRSILETINRSLATQMNAMFILFAILLFGGPSIRSFIAVLLVGLLSGTYSSIFIATPLLVSWEEGEIPLVS